MQNSQEAAQQLMMQVAQALQQGADPQAVAQQLMQMGYSQDQAIAIIQQVAGQPTMAEGGDTYYQGMSYAKGGSFPYTYAADPYTYMAMGGMIPTAEMGMETPPRPEAQDFPDYGSFKSADDAWMSQYGPDAINVNDYYSDYYQDPSAIAAYENPALDLVQSQIPIDYSPVQSSYTNTDNTDSKSKLIDFITALGGKTDFKTRKAIAKTIGIRNYTGNKDQDAEMLNYLRAHADAVSKNPQAHGIPASAGQHIKKVIEVTTPKAASPAPATTPTATPTATPTPTPAPAPTPAPIVYPSPTDLGLADPRELQRSLMSPTGAVPKVMVPSGAPWSFYGKAALATGLPAGAMALNRAATKKVAKEILESPKLAQFMGSVRSNASKQLAENLAADRLNKIKAASKMTAKQKKAYNETQALHDARKEGELERTLLNDAETRQAILEAEEEVASAAKLGVKGSGKATPAIMDAVMANLKAGRNYMKGLGEASKIFMTNKFGKGAAEAYKGIAEFLRGTRLEEGGSVGVDSYGYVPDYGMAYGGTPNAMYGMGMAQGGSIYKEGRDLRDYTRTAAYTPGGWSGYPVDLPPVGWGTASYAAGGQMPQWLAQRRFAAAGNEDKMADYGYDDGGVVVGQEMYATPEQLQKLKKGGYQFEILK
jgi:hypothetical protein